MTSDPQGTCHSPVSCGQRNSKFLTPNQAHLLCSAAINSNGTVATHLFGGTGAPFDFIDAPRTFRLNTGRYQVGFKAPCRNVQIANGGFRLVQLGGELRARCCYVANRAGVPSALFIECFNAAGVDADTSFTVSVSR
jgi:hypothetical protein